MKQKHYTHDLSGTLTQLGAIAMFGHLTPCLFGPACFGHVALSSRRTTTKRGITVLESGGLIRGVINATGTTSLILTPRGAALWNAHHPDDVRAVAGEKASICGPTFRHRQIATAYLVSQMNNPNVIAVIGEFAMNANTTPLDVAALKKLTGKLPDGIIVRELTDEETGEPRRVIEWVEAESAYKKPVEIQKIFSAVIQLEGCRQVLDFDQSFRGLVGPQGGDIWLTMVVQEADIGHVSRLNTAIEAREESIDTHDGWTRWSRVKEMLRVAAVPLKRYSASLNGEVDAYAIDRAEIEIAARLRHRARQEMTVKERAQVEKREAQWIAGFEARNAARAANGEPVMVREPMPDYGFEVRQKRPPSRRPVVDLAEPTPYPPVVRRRRREMDADAAAVAAAAAEAAARAAREAEPPLADAAE